MPAPEPDDEIPFAVELCSKSGAFEVSPETSLDLDLDELAPSFQEEGLEVVTNAGVLLVVDTGICHVSMFESGRLLVKTSDEDEAQEATRMVYDRLEGAA